ncbi:MAG: tRNA (adenosine(37)-N6)-threonylcarbamoyltransferase complex ATPase subunit type 1 TsaE [Candidatus Pelagibacter sp.]|nr:tRNA (adenosine(37)-N6)-threonylcarbamoyltransferase complex ATPase subunit type 1 TsaE [Candidatus Pelagibacter sp.]|tara:strand:+ start:3012 stop:3485 length:474 start_codon:yes stop_codon:yes gene_type:complete
MHIGTSSKKLDITSEIKTKEVSEKFSNYLKKGDIVYLYGDIGTGKTTFVKYLINYLQKKNNEKIIEILSPTFNILNEYEINDLKVLHYDLYRIKDQNELVNLGLITEQKESLIFIEWPNLINTNSKKTINLNFKYEDNFNKRSLTIKSNNSKIINGL